MELIQALKKMKVASRKLLLCEEREINAVLKVLAHQLRDRSRDIIAANSEDLSDVDSDDHIYDRILLDGKRIWAMADSLLEIAGYSSPIGEIIEEKVLANGLKLKKVRVPLGVVGAIFEARPNVVIDTFALCFKSRNACVMKGGSQCERSNSMLMQIILQSIREVNPALLDAVILLLNDHAAVAEFLQQNEYVDVIIPRGGQGLIDFVRENSRIPVIETGRGVCHTYFDETADLDIGREIIFNAKVSRPSVCNALDTLIIHKDRLRDLAEICHPLVEKNVEIFADKEAFAVLDGVYPMSLLEEAEEGNFGCEFLALKMSVKTVGDLDEALEHINKYGSGHSEAIITGDQKNAEIFLRAVDAACVYVNASTRFTDGGVFGLGAEIGVSTQKLHARGPMGIKELTSYKWEIRGSGQVRKN